MASQYNVNSHFTIDIESAYGTASGNAGNPYPFVDGGDGLAQAHELIPRRSLSGRGRIDMIKVRSKSDGPLAGDFDYDQMDRLLYAWLGGQETDDATSPLSGLYDNYYYPTSALQSWAIAAYRGGTLETYTGCHAVSWQLAASSGDVATWSTTWAGLAPTLASTSADPTFPTFKPLEYGHMTTCSLGGENILSLLRDWEINGENGLDIERYGPSSASRLAPVRTDAMTVSGSFLLDLDDAVRTGSGADGLLDSWIDNESGLTFNMVYANGLASTSQREFEVYCPNIRVTGEPVLVENVGHISARVTWEALDGTVSAGTLGTVDAGSNAERTDAPIMFRLSNSVDGDAI